MLIPQDGTFSPVTVLLHMLLCGPSLYSIELPVVIESGVQPGEATCTQGYGTSVCRVYCLHANTIHSFWQGCGAQQLQ